MPNLHLIGPTPPPYGGVAIHIIRLAEALAAHGVYSKVVSTGGATPLMLARVFTRTARSPLAHFHTDEGNFKSTILFSRFWKSMGVPYILTTHSFRQIPQFSSQSALKHLRVAYKLAAARVAISDSTKAALIDVLNLDPATVTVIPSALPISNAERNAPLPNLPDAWQGAPVRILANAGRLTLFNNEDLYGLDLVVNAMRLLPDNDVHVLLAVADVVDESLFRNLEAASKSDPRIHLVRSSWPLARVVSHSHIVLRPTRTEGGPSLTLSEAIEMGTYTVGSDSVLRPPETQLFTNGNATSLAHVLASTIADVRAGKAPAPSIPNPSALRTLLEVYATAGLVNTLHTPADV